MVDAMSTKRKTKRQRNQGERRGILGTVPEVAAYTGLSKETVRWLFDRGLFRGPKRHKLRRDGTGRPHRRILWESVDDYCRGDVPSAPVSYPTQRQISRAAGRAMRAAVAAEDAHDGISAGKERDG